MFAALTVTAFAGSAAVAAASIPASGAFDLDAYKGKVVYLDFWASWCHPCEQSFPYMETLKQTYGQEGLAIVAVNVDHSRSRADAFLRKMQSDLHVVYDPKGALAKQFHVKDMPTSVLIGRDGKVRYVHEGFFTDKMALYDSHIAELLHAH